MVISLLDYFGCGSSVFSFLLIYLTMFRHAEISIITGISQQAHIPLLESFQSFLSYLNRFNSTNSDQSPFKGRLDHVHCVGWKKIVFQCWSKLVIMYSTVPELVIKGYATSCHLLSMNTWHDTGKVHSVPWAFDLDHVTSAITR